MSYLDLHGVRHHEVDRQVENFVLLNQNILPLKIICGNSEKMQALVKKTLDKIHVQYSISFGGNIIIFKI